MKATQTNRNEAEQTIRKRVKILCNIHIAVLSLLCFVINFTPGLIRHLSIETDNSNGLNDLNMIPAAMMGFSNAVMAFVAADLKESTKFSVMYIYVKIFISWYLFHGIACCFFLGYISSTSEYTITVLILLFINCIMGYLWAITRKMISAHLLSKDK